MKKALDEMSIDELQAELDRIKNDLEDLTATFNFNLANTPDHHNEAAIMEHEEEIAEYRQKISSIEQMIQEKQNAST